MYADRVDQALSETAFLVLVYRLVCYYGIGYMLLYASCGDFISSRCSKSYHEGQGMGNLGSLFPGCRIMGALSRPFLG